jgi:hypothetical protein
MHNLCILGQFAKFSALILRDAGIFKLALKPRLPKISQLCKSIISETPQVSNSNLYRRFGVTYDEGNVRHKSQPAPKNESELIWMLPKRNLIQEPN